MIQSYGITPNQKAWRSSMEYKHSTRVNKLTGLNLHTNPLFDRTFFANGQNLLSENHRQSTRLRDWSSGLMAMSTRATLAIVCSSSPTIYSVHSFTSDIARYSRTDLQLTTDLSMSFADKFSLPWVQLAVSFSPGPATTIKTLLCLSKQDLRYAFLYRSSDSVITAVV